VVDHRRFSGVLAEFAHNLVADYGIGDVLIQLSDRAAQLLPVDGTGIMLRAGDGLEFVTATDEAVGRVEQLQVSLGEGPCVTAASTGEAVLVPDLAAGPDRFPTFAAAAVLRGMRAVFAFPMTVRAERIGVLNLYRRTPGGLSDEDVAAAEVLTNVAAAYVLNSENLAHHRSVAAQLQEALDSRVVVEQAKGKLAAELGTDPDTAFECIRAYARHRNLRVRQVADNLVHGRLTSSDLQ
jgi:GAF domain-containing protein